MEGELVGGKLADALLALVEVSGAGGGERRQSDRPVSTGNRPNTKLREYWYIASSIYLSRTNCVASILSCRRGIEIADLPSSVDAP